MDCFTSFARTGCRDTQGQRVGIRKDEFSICNLERRPRWWADGWIASLRSQGRGVGIHKDGEWEDAKTDFQYVFAYYVLERPDLVEQLGTPTRSGSIYIIAIATVANFCVGNTFG
jgi:hypothetical protein